MTAHTAPPAEPLDPDLLIFRLRCYRCGEIVSYEQYPGHGIFCCNSRCPLCLVIFDFQLTFTPREEGTTQ